METAFSKYLPEEDIFNMNDQFVDAYLAEAVDAWILEDYRKASKKYMEADIRLKLKESGNK